MTRRPTSLLFASLLLVGSPTTAPACSVPVFRYALEHWAPDIYQGLVFHEGPLSGPSAEAAVQLRNSTHANLSVRFIDLARPDNAEWQTARESLEANTLPWIVVRPEPRTGYGRPVHSEPLQPGKVARLLDSPARRTIAQRIAAGESAVWVFLESGKTAEDHPASQRLEERLTYLESVLEIPELSDTDISNGLISVGGEGLRLDFSVLRVSRQDPEEAAFVRMLLAVESDLAELDQPMAFPVFGRGRVLYALVGAGIQPETIDQAATYLVGSCSCELKAQNPGFDLFMAADWDGMVKRQAKKHPVLVPDHGSAKPETVTIAPSTPESTPGPEDEPATGNPPWAWKVALLGLFAIIAAWTWFRSGKG